MSLGEEDAGNTVFAPLLGGGLAARFAALAALLVLVAIAGSVWQGHVKRADERARTHHERGERSGPRSRPVHRHAVILAITVARRQGAN